MSEKETRPLAVFDLDGTLFRGDSLLPFLVGLGIRQRRWTALCLIPVYLLLYACGLQSDRSAKQALLQLFLRGCKRKEVQEYAEQFAVRWRSHRVLAAGMERLTNHLKAGHRVVLLSASPDIYVPELARQLRIEEVVCTQVRWQGDVCLGEIVGPNCKGEAKLEMLKAYLGMDEAPDESYGYGDSKSDLPVLRWVKQGWIRKWGDFRRFR